MASPILLASDTKDGDGECYLLERIHQSRRMQKQLYEFVDDDGELDYMSQVFQRS